MLVREDDTLICVECYVDDRQDPTFDAQPHRWPCATITHGACDVCGLTDSQRKELSA